MFNEQLSLLHPLHPKTTTLCVNHCSTHCTNHIAQTWFLDLNKLKALVRGTNGLGCVLSGAGSSVLIIVNQRNQQDMMHELTGWCQRQSEGYKVLNLDVDTNGLRADYESFN